MPTVFLCSPYNSTMFTTCCQVAILDDQIHCPHCRKEITPHGRRSRWEFAYGKQRRQRELLQNREEDSRG